MVGKKIVLEDDAFVKTSKQELYKTLLCGAKSNRPEKFINLAEKTGLSVVFPNSGDFQKAYCVGQFELSRKSADPFTVHQNVLCIRK